MVNIIENSKDESHAKFVVYYTNKDGKSIINETFECWLHKDRTARQLIRMVSMFYDLNVNSFHLILMSYKSDRVLKTRIKDKLKLVVNDDYLLSSYGLVFNEASQYNFVLFENDPSEENYQAECIVCLPKERKFYSLTVDKNITVDQLFKQVLRLCQNDNFNTDSFVLTFNFNKIITSAELVKLKITEDDTRLLSDIGVIYGQGVKNRFEVTLDSSSGNVGNEISFNLCSPTKIIKQELNTKNCIFLVQNDPVLSSNRTLYHKSTKLTEYRGLVNEALTCYLNSLLQALFMTPEFRNALYHWKFDPNANLDESQSIPFQLQKLFLNLQTSPRKSVETRELTRSFGWNSNEIWQQQDIQELCRVMFDSLEMEFRNTTHINVISHLYKGIWIDYVECLECGVVKSREDQFLDIPLSLRPFGSTNAYASITEALKGFIQPETLEGSNQYYCDRCDKKCDAQKGLKFKKFPYILTLHLMRFAFDHKNFNRIKLNDKVVFPLILNLNSFISNPNYSQDNEDALIDEYFKEMFNCGDGSYIQKGSSPDLDEINQNEEESIDQHRNEDEWAISSNMKNELFGPYIYELYAIMIHSGDASRGHYYAYIKDFKTGQWICFNDQSVSEITMDDIEKSFGGGPIYEYSDQQTSSTNAYMLMYRQIDKRRNRNAMTPEEFPPHVKDLHNILQQKFEENKQLREKELSIFKVPVYFMECDISRQFDCYRTTTVAQLKAMVVKYFEVTEPCRLVIYNKMMQKVIDDLEHQSKSLVGNLKYNLPCVLLLETVGIESCQPAPQNILMKLFIINLDDNEEDVNVNHPLYFEIEPNKRIGDLSKLLYMEFDIPIETTLHFAVYSRSEPLVILEPTIECGSVYANSVFVFIDCHVITQSVIMQKMKNIINRYDTINNAIQLQFVMPSKNTDVSEHLMESCNLNSINSEDKLTSSSEYLSENSLNDCNLSTEDNYFMTNPEGLIDIPISDENGDQCEDNITGDERIIMDVIQDNEIDYEHDRLDTNNKDETGDNNEIKSNKNRMFIKLDFKSISDQVSKNESNQFYAFIDKRMTVNELKNHLAPYINIPFDFIILNRYISENKLEELDLPSRSLEDLNNNEIIHISIGESLHNSQYRGTIFLFEHSEQTKIVLKEMFHWIITVGTSVLDTKKKLIAKLHETQNIDIPLERCRLRKKKDGSLMQCYLNNEIWNEDIGQNWEMVILDLKDRFELELEKTKRLMFVNHVVDNDSQQFKISEMEFTIEIASVTSISKQLAKKISEKLDIPEYQIELGYMHDHSTEIIWKTSASQWSFGFFDYFNAVLFCRFVDKTITNKKVPYERCKQRREGSLKIGINKKL